jgi:hypothetical protein
MSPHRCPNPCQLLKCKRWICIGASALAAAGTGAADETWPVAGRQGIIQFVIVPTAMAKDREAYLQQIQQLCGGQETCFINFYTNSKSVPVAMPLPDEIFQEATAVLRRSGKQQVDSFRWSCRLGQSEPACF